MPPGRSRRTVLVAVLAAAGLAFGSSAASAPTCPSVAQCTTLTVALDHSHATPGTLPLAYARVPATGTRTGTLVFLAGGPGQAAISFATGFAEQFKALRGSYDLVFVDQRGTGESGAVDCKSITTPDDVTACANLLGVKRAFFSTAETSYDLEDLRVALGVDKLTLLGVSYGAKVAGDYARRFPAHTAGLILDSPSPVDGIDALGQLRALGSPRVLREVCSPGPCAQTVTDPGAALDAAVKRLQKGGVKAPLVLASGKVSTSVNVTVTALYNAIGASDLSPGLRAGLPAAIASLAAGDAAPFVHLAVLYGGSGSGGADQEVNSARLLATTCIEGRLPWAPDAPLAGRADALAAFVAARADAFAPFGPKTVIESSIATLCTAWPPTPAPPAVATAGPDVPVLVISGRDDLRTPTEDARRTAAQYPHATLLAVAGVGHSVLGSEYGTCALAGLTEFLSGAAVEQCAAQGATAELQDSNSPFIPATVDKLRPLKLKGLAGQTLSAVQLTLLGAANDVINSAGAGGSSIRVPGLRGGYVRATKSGLEFHDVVFVRGVVVNGTVSAKNRAKLVVSGSAAAPGTVVTVGSKTIATLGGQTTTVG